MAQRNLLRLLSTLRVNILNNQRHKNGQNRQINLFQQNQQNFTGNIRATIACWPQKKSVAGDAGVAVVAAAGFRTRCRSRQCWSSD